MNIYEKNMENTKNDDRTKDNSLAIKESNNKESLFKNSKGF